MKKFENGIYSDDFTIFDSIEDNDEEIFKLHENTKYINKFAFMNYTFLKEIILPEGLEVIDLSAFENCIHLEKINFPSTIRLINTHAFENCTSLKQIDLSQTKLEKIEVGTFKDCKNLEKVILPKSVKELMMQAFSGCNIKEINLENIRNIWDGVFHECKNLNLVIPESVKTFAISSLSSTNTKTLFIPETVEQLICTPLPDNSIEKIVYTKLNPNIDKNFLIEKKNFNSVIVEDISIDGLISSLNSFKEINKAYKDSIEK